MSFVAGLAVCLALLVVYARTRHAPRSRRFAWIGMVLAGCAVGCFASAPFLDARPLVERLGWGIVSAATGIAHACAFNLVPLPPQRTKLRMLLVPVGLWAGGAGSFAILAQHQPPWIDLLALALALPVAATWACVPFATRRPARISLGGKEVPCLRFNCPRCGTVVDWPSGVWPCTDCGLFLKLDLPADSRSPASRPDDDAGAVRLDCPQCGAGRVATRGASSCAACGTSLSMHWNMHR